MQALDRAMWGGSITSTIHGNLSNMRDYPWSCQSLQTRRSRHSLLLSRDIFKI